MSDYVAHEQTAASQTPGNANTPTAITPKRSTSSIRTSRSSSYERSRSRASYTPRNSIGASRSPSYERNRSRASCSSQGSANTLVASPKNESNSFDKKNRDSIQRIPKYEEEEGDMGYPSAPAMYLSQIAEDGSESTASLVDEAAGMGIELPDLGKKAPNHRQQDIRVPAGFPPRAASLSPSQASTLNGTPPANNEDAGHFCGVPIWFINVICSVITFPAAICTGFALGKPDSEKIWPVIIGSIMFLAQLLHTFMDLHTLNETTKRATSYAYIIGILVMVACYFAAMVCFAIDQVYHVELAQRTCETFFIFISIVYLLMANVRRAHKEHKRGVENMV